MKHIILASLISIIRIAHALNFHEDTHNNVIQLIPNVINNFFSNFECVSLITEHNGGSSTIVDEFYKLKINSVFILDLSLVSDDDRFDELDMLHTTLETVFESACTGFIVQLNSPSRFLKAWKSLAKSSLHRQNPRTLLLPTEDSCNISKEILDCGLKEFIMDLTMVDMEIKTGAPTTLHFITYDFNSKVQPIGSCSGRKCLEFNLNLFPNKLKNLEHKEIKIATFYYPPYAILEELDGTEVRITKEFVRIHNSSLGIVTDKAEWGEIHANGTGNGILGNVAEEKADLGLGALYLWYHEYQFLDFSVPYIRTGITCLAPKPEQVTSLLLLVRPFNLITWLIIVLVLITACGALYFIKKIEMYLSRSRRSGDRRRHRQWFTTQADTALRTFGFLVQQASSNHLIETTSIRHLVNWLHFMFLILATSYNSGLASILTVPSYEPPIDSVADLVNSKLPWGATHDAWTFSLREATQPNLRTLYKRFQATPKDELHQYSLTSNFAFSIERLPAGHFAVGDYITEESMKHLRLMKEDIYYEYCTIVFPKGSPYIKSFNKLIHRLMDSGLLLFWEGEVARKFLNSSVQSAVKDSTMSLSQPLRTKIKLSHFEGAFITLQVGLLLGFLSFLLEYYIGNRSQVRQLKKKKRVTILMVPICYYYY